jgi:predicted DNA-binding transcriptional regulator
MDIEFLQKIGLSKGEIKVYSALLDLGSASLNAIQEKTAIERRNIYDILNKLIEKGLASYIVEKRHKTYQLTHPKKILGYLEDKEREIENTKNKLKPRVEEIIQQYNMSKNDTKAEVFRGNEAIKTILVELLEYDESFWMGGNNFEKEKAVPRNLQVYFSHWMEKRAKQGHIMNDLVSYKSFFKGLEPEKTEEHKKQLYKFCSLPEGIDVPMVIIIFGTKVAQIQWGGQSFAFVLDSDKIKTSYLQYFKHFWKPSW